MTASAANASPAIKIKVVKGCNAIGVTKGQTANWLLSAVAGVGVQAGTIRGSRTLWLSGNRVNVPAFKVGDTFNCNTGNPLHSVKVEVVGVLA